MAVPSASCFFKENDLKSNMKHVSIKNVHVIKAF